jgi:hypothetical protein
MAQLRAEQGSTSAPMDWKIGLGDDLTKAGASTLGKPS